MTIELPLDPAEEALPDEPTILLNVSLDRARRGALDKVAEELGLGSRAAAIRIAARVVLDAALAGARIKGHVRALDGTRSSEGVLFSVVEAQALAAASARLGVPRATALRWGCDTLVDAHRNPKVNGRT